MSAPLAGGLCILVIWVDRAISKCILAIDTATEVCSVALQFEDEIHYLETLEPRSHAKRLLPLVEQVFKRAGCELADLESIVVTIGPGSFTGIRIGISVAQGLSYSLGIPLVGVSSLELLAQQAKESLGDDWRGYIVPALDARMSEVYWASYCVNNSSFDEHQNAKVSSPQTLTQFLLTIPEGEPVYGVGHGWAVEPLCDYEGECNVNAYPKASSVFALTLPEPVKNSVLEPLYVRNEVSWAKRKKIRNTSN